MIPVIDSILGVVKEGLKFIPDPNKRRELEAQAEARIVELMSQSDTNQSKVNEIEAGSGDKFASRWRPFVGWVCAVGMTWAFVIRPIAEFFIAIYKPGLALPDIAVVELTNLLFGMLGMSYIRSVDKRFGVSK